MTVSPGWGPTPRPPVQAGWVTPDQDVLTRVTVAGLRLVTAHAQTPAGPSATFVSEIDGWYDTPRDLTDTIEHWTGDGVLALLPRLGARTVRIRGHVHARTPRAALEAQDALARVRGGVLVIEERTRGVAREADVRAVSLTFDRRTPEFLYYDLTVQADDPLRYGSAAVTLTNGAVTLTNRGDATAYPVLDLVGPHGGLSVTHPGGAWTLAALASGQSRTVDLRNGDVWAGNVRVHGLETGPAPIVPAGGASWTVAGLGAGSARARRTEAWT